MRHSQPLALGLVLALVATTALAADSARLTSRRASLLEGRSLAPQAASAEAPAANDRLLRRTPNVDGAARIGELPSPPRLTGAGDGGPVANQAGLARELHARDASPVTNFSHHGIRVTDDPAYQTAFEAKRQRGTAVVIHAVDRQGNEILVVK